MLGKTSLRRWLLRRGLSDVREQTIKVPVERASTSEGAPARVGVSWSEGAPPAEGAPQAGRASQAEGAPPSEGVSWPEGASWLEETSVRRSRIWEVLGISMGQPGDQCE